MKLAAECVSSRLQMVKTKPAFKRALKESRKLGMDHSAMKIVTNTAQDGYPSSPPVVFKNIACTAAFVNSKQSWLFGRKNPTVSISRRQISETATAIKTLINISVCVITNRRPVALC